LILKEFCGAGSSLLKGITSLQNSLGQNAVFSFFCAERGLKTTTIPEPNITRWSSLHRMVESIVELRPTILDFVRTNSSLRVEESVFVLAGPLKGTLDKFTQLLMVMESDAFGNISNVFCTFQSIRKTLADAPANWRHAADAGVLKLDALIDKYRAVLSPLIEIATRLNPNFDSELLFEIADLDRFDDLIVQGMGTGHASQDPSLDAGTSG
jgi:hypothetical protein